MLDLLGLQHILVVLILLDRLQDRCPVRSKLEDARTAFLACSEDGQLCLALHFDYIGEEISAQ